MSSPNTPTSRSSRPRTPKSAKKTPASSRASSKGSKRSKSAKSAKSKKKESRERKKRNKKDKKKKQVEEKEPDTKEEPEQSVKYDLKMKQSDPKMPPEPVPSEPKPVTDKPASDKPAEPKPVRSDPKLTASEVRLKPSDPRPTMSDPKLKQSQPGSGTDTDTSQPKQAPLKKAPSRQGNEWLYVLFFMAETLGLSIIVLTIAWIHSYAGGFSLKGPNKLKSWHPFLMTVGPVYLLANSLLTYQMILKKNKPNLKKAHMLINSLTLVCVVASQITLAMHSCEKIQSLKKDSYEPFYSLHAWIGVLGIVVFFIQYVLEAIMFLFPNKKMVAKLRMAKTNVILGVSTLFVSIVACVSGYLQQLMEHHKSWSTRIFPGTDLAKNEEIVMNTIGLLSVIFICLIVYLVFDQMINKKSSPSRSASRDRVNRNDPRVRRDASQPTVAGGPSQPKRY